MSEYSTAEINVIENGALAGIILKGIRQQYVVGYIGPDACDVLARYVQESYAAVMVLPSAFKGKIIEFDLRDYGLDHSMLRSNRDTTAIATMKVRNIFSGIAFQHGYSLDVPHVIFRNDAEVLFKKNI